MVTKNLLVISPSARTGLTDYAVESKAFIFSFADTEGVNQSDMSVADSILSNYPPMTPVMGFFGLGGEGNTISNLSQREMMMTVSDDAADLSFYSGFPNAMNLQQTTAAPVTYSSSKTYVMWQFTQGDAVAQYLMYTNWDTWNTIDPATNQPYRDEVATDWQFNPMLAELAPPIMNEWYSTASPLTDFVTGPSGGPYVHPDMLPNENGLLGMVGHSSDTNAQETFGS